MKKEHTNENTRRLVKTSELAEIYGVTVRDIRMLVSEGKLRPISLTAKWLFKVTDLEEILEECRI